MNHPIELPAPESPAVRYLALTGREQGWLAACADLLAREPGRLAGLLAPGGADRAALAEDPRSYLREPTTDPLATPAGPTPAESAAAAIRDLALALAEPTHPATADRLARAAGHWRQARVLLEPGGTAPPPVWTTPAGDDPPRLAALRPALAALADRPAAGYLYLVARTLLGAPPPSRHGVAVPVLFDQRDGGSVAELRLQYLPDGPPGLYPDPAMMSFLATDQRFADALATAWRLSPYRDRGAVVWSVTQAGIPCNDAVHGSLGAAFGVALGELHRRRTWRRRWLRFRVLRAASAITGVLGTRGELLPVSGVANKFRAAGEAGLRVIAPKPEMSEVARHADEHRVSVAFAGDLAEAARLAYRVDLRRVTAWATVAAVLLAGAPAAAWSTANAIDRERAAGQAQLLAASQSLAAASLDVTAHDPQLSDVLAAAAYHLAATPEAEQNLYRAVTRPALAAVPAGSWARFTPDGEVIAAHQDGSLRRFDRTRHLPSEPLAPANAADDPLTPRAVAASPDGTTGAWGDPDGYLHLWDHAADAPLGGPVPAHRSGVARVEFSPDGRLVATVTNPDGGPSEGFTDDSRTVRLWDAGTGQLVRAVRTDHKGFIRALAFSPDGTLLATGADPTIYFDTPDDPGSGPTVGIWDVRTGEPVGTPMTEQPVTALAFHPDGVTLAAGGRDGTVWQWDPVAGAELTAPITGHTGEIRALRFSADGEVLASGGAGDNRVRLWAAGTAESLAEALEGHESPVTSIDFAPDDTSLVSTDAAGMLRLWDVDPARVGEPFFDRTAERTLVAYQPDGAILAVAGWDGVIQLWRDGAEGFRLDEGVILARQGQIRALAFDPSGGTLATGGDGSVRLWDPTTGRLRHHLDDPTGAVRSVAFSPDGDRLVAAGDGGVHLWQTDPPRLEWTIPAGKASFTAVAFAPTGASLVGGDRAGDIYEWDPVDGAPVQRMPGHAGAVTGVTFAPGGDELATVGTDATVRIWEPGADAPRSTLIGDPWTATAVAYHPDGELLATAGLHGVRLWDRASGRIRHRYRVDTATAVTFTPDGERLVAANAVRRVTIWSTVEPDAAPVALYDARPGNVTAHAVSPDGTRTAALSRERVLLPPPPPDSAGDDDSALARSVIRIHDTATRRPVQVIVLPESATISFTADSESLDVLTADGRLRSWHIATGEPTRDEPLSDEPLSDPQTSAVLAAVSEDRQWAVVAPRDPGRPAYEDGGRITVVDLPGGQTIHNIQTGTQPITALATSATAGMMAAGFADGRVRLWELATGTEHGSFQADPSGSVTALAFAPGGDWLAVAAGHTRQWTVNGEPGQALPGTAEREITALAFSPSGATVAAGGGELTLHHTATGTVIHSVESWGGSQYATLQFDPTGRMLHVSMSGLLMAGAVDVSYTDDPLGRLCERIGRAVTATDWAAYVPDAERIDPGPVCAD